MKEIDTYPYKGHVIHIYDSGSELIFKVSKDGHLLSTANHAVTKMEGEYDPQYYNNAFYLMIQAIESILPKFIVSYAYKKDGSTLNNFLTYRNAKMYTEQMVIKTIEHYLQTTEGLSNILININFHREIKPTALE
jgi:hypothetical protein